MSLKSTQPAVSKIELPKSTNLRWTILSRVRNPDTRLQLELGDNWQVHLGYDKEHQALADFNYLNRVGAIREHMLIAYWPKLVTMVITGSDDMYTDEVPY